MALNSFPYRLLISLNTNLNKQYHQCHNRALETPLITGIAAVREGTQGLLAEEVLNNSLDHFLIAVIFPPCLVRFFP